MSRFVVSARKYRPRSFDEVVGQSHVSETLRNALLTNQVAHAFLFTGPRGVGKTTMARILAQVLNCENPSKDMKACNECASCKAFNESASFNIIELDAASNNSVEHIRSLIEQVRFPPRLGKYKVFIIDEVHMLSSQAFNAFLKTLEEPPPYAKFILATTEKHKILPTILSRCQIFDFKQISVADMVTHLQKIAKSENIKAEPEALHIIARKAGGALRDALSIFDRMAVASAKNITKDTVVKNLNILDEDYFFKIIDAATVEDVATVLQIFNEISRKGFQPDLFLTGLADHLRNLLFAKDPKTAQLLDVGESSQKELLRQAGEIPLSFVLSAMNIINNAGTQLNQAVNKRLHVEMALIKMTFIEQALSLHTSGADIKKNSKPQLKPKKQTQPAGPQPPAGDALAEPAVAYSSPEPASPIDETKAAPELSKSQNGTGGLSLELKYFEEAVESEIEKNSDKTPKLNQQALQKAWDEYLEKVESASIRQVLKSAVPKMKDKEVIISTGGAYAIHTLRQETSLAQYLREQLNYPDLVIRYEIDESLAPEEKESKKTQYMTNKEKFDFFRSKNPAILEFVKLFDLKMED